MTLPPLHAPYAGTAPDVALTDLRSLIEDAILNQPRSLQTAIGPSEIGTPCDHCLAAKLAGWKQGEREVAWLPFIGTAVHAALADIVVTHENTRNAVHTTGLRYLSEQRVMVGQVDGVDITGSTDLVDIEAATVIDFKIVGASTLKAARRGPSPVYRAQADLYAKGWNDAGVRIDHVAIAYLPRNAVSLNDAVWWHAPHDRGNAERALERASSLARNLKALTALGPDAVTAYIATLARAEGCWDCPRFPGGERLPKPGHRPPANQLAGLVA